ncbi:MAG: AmmeMemoRadiSam system protein A [Candidatus Aminicenantes bacterium]|nr:AmmeMemoRadiSam system protein A [Candidatus Aminicenantes bacterium]
MDNKLVPAQQETLLQLAREAVTLYLETGDTLKKNITDKSFLEQRGAFVTLKVKGELRGCIGYPIPFKSLYATIIDAAVSATSSDYRFQPLTTEELHDTKIEISVLTPPRPVNNIHEIEVGIHGIIISKESNKGLLLPQVPIEWNWDLETYLEHGCLKAGLDKDEWKRDAQIEIFSAQVFSE